jgi:hypothetical protein
MDRSKKCCGGPLDSLVDRQGILQIRETGFTPRAPLFEKSLKGVVLIF